MSQQTALRTTARAAPRTAARPGRRPAPLRVVPGAIQRTGNAAFAGICVALMVAGLVTLLLLNTSLAQGAFDLSDLTKSSGTLTDTQQQLTASIDEQRSPRSLAAAAQQLGLVPAQSMAFLRLSDGKIIGSAEPASPAARLTIVTSPTPAGAAAPVGR
ncbi:hypothetical protein V3N99_18015 [Dermatophilaceae bacterium Soc4.6]